MNILSLFDGMSCGQMALQRAGIKVNKYYASEIDKFAIKVSSTKFPDTIHLGSVEDWRNWDIDWSSINLIMAGSPCQGFSNSGKGLAFDDPRSKLFFTFVDILNHCKQFNTDVTFLLENVKMKKVWSDTITQFMGAEPIFINSALVSAQNRKRLYWTNIKGVKQPEDKGLLLKDILENSVSDRYYLSDKTLQGFENRSKRHAEKGNGFKFEPADGSEKAKTLQTTNGSRITDTYIKEKYYLSEKMVEYLKSRGKEPTNLDGKAHCLTGGGNSGGLHSQMDVIAEPHFGENYVQRDSSGKGYKSQQDRVYYEESKFGILPASNPLGKLNVLTPDYRIRRLTPIECCRLQTVDDDYFTHDGKQIVSDTQVYKMLGNGWTVDVIAHILSTPNKLTEFKA